MSPIYYLRIFNLDKYQEIEPIINTIHGRNADPDEVYCLIQQAMNIATDEFRQSNQIDNNLHEYYIYCLEKALNSIQAGNLLEWSNNKFTNETRNEAEYIMPYLLEVTTYQNSNLQTESLDTNDTNLSNVEENVDCGELINILLSLICCSQHQNSLVEYTDVSEILCVFNRSICKLLDIVVEDYRSDINYASDFSSLNRIDTKIVKQESLAILTSMVEKDVLNLSQPDRALYLTSSSGIAEYHMILPKVNQIQGLETGDCAAPNTHEKLLKFYRSLNNVLKIVNSQDFYTIANQIVHK